MSPHVVARAAGERGPARPRRVPHDLLRVPGAGHVPRRLGGHRSRWARSPWRPASAASPARRPARGCTRPTPTGWSCTPPPRPRPRSPCWPRSSTASPWPPRSCRRLRGHQRAGQGLARRDHPARGAREPAGVGVRAVGDLLQLAWVVGGALGIALPPTGWLGFTVAAALLVLAVGLIVWSLYRGGPRAVRPAVSPDAADDTPWGRGGREAACAAAALLLLVSPACGRGAAAGARGRAGWPSAPRRCAVHPTQYCLDGKGQALRRHAADHRGRPRLADHPDRPGVRGRARLERAGLRREAREAARRGRRARRAGGASTRSTPPTSSRRRSTSSSSRRRAAPAGGSPARGRSASCAPAGDAAAATPSEQRRAAEGSALQVGGDRAQHRADLARLRPVGVPAAAQAARDVVEQLDQVLDDRDQLVGLLPAAPRRPSRPPRAAGRGRAPAAPGRRGLPATMPNSTRWPGLSSAVPAGRASLCTKTSGPSSRDEEAETLLRVEPLDLAGGHVGSLGCSLQVRHAGRGRRRPRGRSSHRLAAGGRTGPAIRPPRAGALAWTACRTARRSSRPHGTRLPVHRWPTSAPCWPGCATGARPWSPAAVAVATYAPDLGVPLAAARAVALGLVLHRPRHRRWPATAGGAANEAAIRRRPAAARRAGVLAARSPAGARRGRRGRSRVLRRRWRCSPR